MKKLSSLLLLVLVLFISSCSVQEVISPEIFIERLLSDCNDLSINITDAFYENGKYNCFILFDDTEYVLQLKTDDKNNIKKICLACTSANKTEKFKLLSERIIGTYAPAENSVEIISDLFISNWDFAASQWYGYSSAISDKGLFFSIENLKISTGSDAELTLKENDRVNP